MEVWSHPPLTHHCLRFLWLVPFFFSWYEIPGGNAKLDFFGGLLFVFNSLIVRWRDTNISLEHLSASPVIFLHFLF